MKTLDNYMDEMKEKLFNECGLFFAFNDEQFKSGLKKVNADVNNKVVGLGAGVFVLSKNAEKFLKEIKKVRKLGINQDLSENGKYNIIMRELGNFETEITYDLNPVIKELKGYNIPIEEIREVFYNSFLPKKNLGDKMF